MGLLGSDISTNNSQEDWTWLDSNYIRPFFVCFIFNALFIIVCMVLKKRHLENSGSISLYNEFLEHMYKHDMKSEMIDFDTKMERIEKLHTMEKKIRSKS